MSRMILAAAIGLGGLLALATAANVSAAPAASAAPAVQSTAPSTVEPVQYWRDRPYYWNHRHWRHRHWDWRYRYWRYYD